MNEYEKFEVYCAVKTGRMGIGVELKPSYYRQSVKNIENAEKNIDIEQQELSFKKEEDDEL